jgi:hypothetical protein
VGVLEAEESGEVFSEPDKCVCIFVMKVCF